MSKNLNDIYDVDNNYAVYFLNSKNVAYFVMRAGSSDLRFCKSFTNVALVSRQSAETVYNAIRELMPDYAVTMVHIEFDDVTDTYIPKVVKYDLGLKEVIDNANESKS